jgi:transposase-like protein
MGQRKSKKEVVEEYLGGGISLRELGIRYGINHRTIHRWVKAHQGGEVEKLSGGELVEMPKDVKGLERELHEARLEAKLYKTMIEIAEKEMGIPIRKKSGAK